MQSLQAQAEAIALAYQPPATGRPSDIGDEHLLKELFAAIEDGNYLETACDLVGLSHVTVYNWVKRGEAHEQPFDRFLKAYKTAQAKAEAKMLANVRKASDLPQFWAAGMTVLERRHPDRWGKRQDDSSQPKVVVNIGVGVGDVKIGIAFAPPTSTDSLCISEPSGDVGSNNNELCKLTESPQAQALTGTVVESLRSNPDGDPTPAGEGHTVPLGAVSKKGRSFLGRGKKKGG